MKARTLGYAAMLVCATGGSRACFAASCAVTAESLNFGAFTALGGPIEAIGRITVTCRGDPGEIVEYTLALSQNGTPLHERVMSDGEQALGYNLFIDAARAVSWGDETDPTTVVRAALQLTSPIGTREHVVYARAVPGRSTIPGNYADTVLVKLEYGGK